MDLEYIDGKLCLTDGEHILTGDFSEKTKRLKHNNLTHELLIKATKLKQKAGEQIYVVDATAGMGEDSLLLAAAGYKVTLFERDKTIAALLKDSIKRGLDNPELTEIVSRMTLREEDSIEAMKKMADLPEEERPDVILLDPMFPAREKSSLVKKKFQLIHHLEKPCEDEEELLNAAMLAKPLRIVIKRPIKGPFLAGVKPSYSLSGKTVRYDCIVLN